MVENSNGYYCRVIVECKVYLGLTRPGKKQAKRSAAEKAVELHISDNTLQSGEDMVTF